jgi:NADPH:quinone reductase-like Zn-dependent oxidoreductase
MRAAVCHKYGGPEGVEIAEVPTPALRHDDELLVKIHATTVNAADWRVRTAKAPRGFALLVRLGLGLRGPRQTVLGSELAGEVVGAGSAVTRFKPGDKVFAQCRQLACHAEYRVVREADPVALMPANLSYEDAAPLAFGGTTALYFLRDLGQVQPRQRVLINGAAGGVGCAAVQLARHFGAEVTAVCSAESESLARSLGASYVVDYTRQDFARTGNTYDIILDLVGNCDFATTRAALAPRGRLLLAVPSLWQLITAQLRPSRGGYTVLTGDAPARSEDLQLLAELAQQGVFKAVVERVYPFESIVAAHARVETRHKHGNVVITLER